MKAMKKGLGVVLLALITTVGFSQRKISGIVYMDGKPQAGILVEANRTSNSYYTSFDGKYELEINDKTKYLRFTYLDESKKLSIEGDTSSVINFSWDGEPIPEASEAGVVLKTFEQLSKERDMKFLSNFSLYYEFLKQGDSKSALPHWRIIYNSYPKSTYQVYNDGIKMYESYMNNVPDSHTKSLYLDTIMSIFDKRMKYLDNAGEVLQRKAVKYLESILQPSFGLNDTELTKYVKKGYGFAEKAITESGDSIEPAVIVLYMQSAKKLYSAGEISKSELIDNYERSMSTLDKQTSNPDTKDNADKAIQLVEKIIEDSGVLDCKALTDLYGTKFKENPNDIELAKKIIYMLVKEKCTDGELYAKVSEKLYSLDPSPESAFNMANLFVKKSNWDKAFEYYEKAYTTEPDPVKKADYYYYAGMLGLQRGRLQFARDMAREVLKLKSDYCQAYMLLGEVYAQSSKDFSTDEFERSTVFWVAVDYFTKASHIDACATDGANKANFYSNYFPDKEDVFFKSLSEGDRYTVGGWINETTTVRVKK